MPIDAVNGVTTNAMTNALTSVSGTSSDSTNATAAAGATTDGSGFAASLGNAVDGLQPGPGEHVPMALFGISHSGVKQ